MTAGVDYGSLRRQLESTFDWWIDHLGLCAWEGRIIYHEEDIESAHPDVGEYVCPMECVARWEYMQFHVQVFLPNVAAALGGLSNWQHELDRMVVHELCHVLLCELRVELIPLAGKRFFRHLRHEERVASMLTNALLFTRDAATAG